jgi:hypothetical protein
MERFQGKLLDGERLLFGPVSGVFEEETHRGARFGLLEVHEGSAPLLATHRPYRLILDDGRAEEIFITGLRQSGTAGVTTLAFQVPGGLRA